MSPADSPTPYGDMALAYYDAGWTGVFPLPVAAKSPPPDGRTGWDGADALRADVEREAVDHRYGNVAIHLPSGVLGIDVDTYAGKTGADTLAQLIERTDAELPPTWISTARPATASGILWYRAQLPAGRRWVGGLPGVEMIHVGHRYAVVGPSRNPDADGAVYEWIEPSHGEISERFPSPDELAELPEPYVLALSRPNAAIDKVELDSEEGQLLFGRWTTAGEPCGHVHRLLTRHTDRFGLGSSRHDVARDGQLALLRAGEEGHPGVAAALEKFEHAWTEALAGDREGEAEWRRGLAGAVRLVAAQPTSAANWGCAEITPDPEKLPEAFWRRKVHDHIRRAAWAYEVPPDVVMLVVLARLSAMVSPDVRLDLGLRPASLNLFVALIGLSGTGKSEGSELARELLPAPSWLAGKTFLDAVPPNTGEGMVEAYYGWEYRDTGAVNAKGEAKPERVKVQVRQNCYFFLDEGEQLTKVQQRASSTIGNTIRSMWQGRTVGQQNASHETTRVLPAGTYASGLVLGFQRGTALPMLAEAGPGTPQRFVYASTFTTPAPEVAVPYPGELTVNLSEEQFDAGPWRGLLDCDEVIKAEVRAARRARQSLAKSEARDDDLDSHAYLTRGKLAGLLALLENRRHVTEEDWVLAGMVFQTSCAVRDDLVSFGRDTEAKKRDMRNEEYVEREVKKTLAVTEAPNKVERLAARIARYVHEHGPTSRSALSEHVVRKTDRPFRDDAIAMSHERGWTVDVARRIGPGESRPADE